jgi:hypothetical protein
VVNLAAHLKGSKETARLHIALILTGECHNSVADTVI